MAQTLFILILIILVADFGLERYLAILNIKMSGKELPVLLRDIYDPEKYARQQDYFRTNSRFGMLTSTFSFLLIIAMISFGGFVFVDNLVQQYIQNPIWTPIIFFGILFLANDILNIPFELYDTFVIEQKFGFNKITPKLYILDKLKGLAMTIVMGGGILFVVI